jgi:outer membrane receptor protein involved in Fe transport
MGTEQGTVTWKTGYVPRTSLFAVDQRSPHTKMTAMTKHRYVSLTALSVICYLLANGQPHTIRGKVTSSDTKEALSSVSVVLKGTGEGSYTDEKGAFAIRVKGALPVVLHLSSIGFEETTVTVNSAQEVLVSMAPVSSLGQEVVVAATRIPTRILESPVSIEGFNARQIISSPATSYYDMAGALKGVDLTTSSLTFKTISTRGFNGSGSSRVNQIVDGMDNQAPGLNFFIGNFTGLTELDVQSMELLPGASSALYGPGGMNGTVLINSKNPFQYQGLSILAKQGIMHVDKRQRSRATPFHDVSLRWAKAFNNKFAFKVGAQYVSADDWLAHDSSNYARLGNLGKVKPGNRRTDPNYDGINVYGDETSVDIKPFLQKAVVDNPSFGDALAPFLNSPQMVSRTGYNEENLVDPETRNIKLSAALHYKLTNDLEAQLMGFWGTGNTVYTGNNRYAFKGINIGQYKLELKHPKGFIRTYTTQEDAGEAYSTTIAAQYLNEAWKRSFNPLDINGSWFPQYTRGFIPAAVPIYFQAYGEAKAAGKSNEEAKAEAQGIVLANAPKFHQAGRALADVGRPVPGSAPFNQIFNAVRKVPIPNGGRFLEKSQLWMSEGQYNLSQWVKFAEVIVGANIKKYILNSEGTLFIDTAKAITFNEVGAYAQVTKKLFSEKLALSASGRYDKNEDFRGQFTPRATALIRVAKDNNIRISYQTAYRFASTLQKYLRLNVGGYTLLGGLPWVMDFMNTEKYPVHEFINGQLNPNPYVYKEFKPEKMTSFELGYKGLLTKNLLVDVYGYLGKYRNFIGRNVLIQPLPLGPKTWVTAVNSSTEVKARGFGAGLDYRLPRNYAAFLNVYSDVLGSVPSGFQVLFNTPKYRANAGFSNSGLGKNKRIGFSVVARWQDEFYWEGELANGDVAAFGSADAQVSYKFPKIRSMFKLGGTNITNHYYQNAFGNPAIGALYYASFGFNVL